MAQVRHVALHFHNKTGFGIRLHMYGACTAPDGVLVIDGDILIDEVMPFTIDEILHVVDTQGDSAAAK